VADAQAHSRTLRVVLERAKVIQWARMAGTILFLSLGRYALVGGAALCGVESGAGGDGVNARGVAMVERGGAL
jgi:hypothetical protein